MLAALKLPSSNIGGALVSSKFKLLISSIAAGKAEDNERHILAALKTTPYWSRIELDYIDKIRIGNHSSTPNLSTSSPVKFKIIIETMYDSISFDSPLKVLIRST